MKFGERLRALRKQRGLGLREFSKKAGLSPTYISRLENGKENEPRKEKTLLKMAAALEVDPDFLLACVGEVSSVVRARMKANPVLFSFVIKMLEEGPEDQIERATRAVRDGKW